MRTVRWSPAAELLEACAGYEPSKPDGEIDLDYMEHLVNSYERWEQLECYNDLMARLKESELRITRKFLSGERVSEQEQGAARAFRDFRKLVEFTKKRLQTAVMDQRRKAGISKTNGGASERLRERLKSE